MAEGGSPEAKLYGLTERQIERLRVRLLARRSLVTRAELQFLFPGRDAEIAGICDRLPFRRLYEDGQPLYEYDHFIDAMPLTLPEGVAVPTPVATKPLPSRVPMEDL